jgi:hypothetical protein
VSEINTASRVHNSPNSSENDVEEGVASACGETPITQPEKPKANKEVIRKAGEKSEEDFNKNIVYIAAGTLVLSLTFIEKAVTLSTANHIWVLTIAWAFLGATLFINLVSHQISVHFIRRCKKDIRAYEENRLTKEQCETRNERRRNWELALRWISIVTLFIGISSLITFCTINANKMSTENKGGQQSGQSKGNDQSNQAGQGQGNQSQQGSGNQSGNDQGGSSGKDSGRERGANKGFGEQRGIDTEDMFS